jgi:hypothetical protein
LKKHAFYLLTFVLFFFLSCSDLEVEVDAPDRHFDIPGFFKSEALLLMERGAQLEKSVLKDQKRESKNFSKPDWGKEFSAFAGIDLNRRGLIDEYVVDSSFTEKGQLKINYRAKTGGLDVQMVKVLLENNSVISLEILRKNINQVFSNLQTMNYYKDGYVIEGSMEILNIYQTDYHIQGKIVK